MRIRKSKGKTHDLRDSRSPVSSSDVASRVMSANRSKNTKPELFFRESLWACGFRGYRVHPKDVPGRPDLGFSKHKFAVFIHGCFWHRCPNCQLPLPKSNRAFWKEKFANNRARDRRKESEFKQLGWMIMTVWECEISSKEKLRMIHRKLTYYLYD